jgi:hypothetical protein
MSRSGNRELSATLRQRAGRRSAARLVEFSTTRLENSTNEPGMSMKTKHKDKQSGRRRVKKSGVETASSAQPRVAGRSAVGSLESHVIPAQAGIHRWTPAFAGVTALVTFIPTGGPMAHGNSSTGRVLNYSTRKLNERTGNVYENKAQ